MTVPAVVRQLVRRFEDNRAAYCSGAYNEAQLRLEFLDPFFEALGWDMFNKQGYAEAYKDVIHEDAIKIGSATKAPDYAFRIGGTRKFFVEAKKPAVTITGDISAAYQLRRYAWSAKLALSILTNFKEFAVYDCRSKPDKADKTSMGRVMYFSDEDYLEKWDEIAAVFSRDSVLKGSFDKYAETAKGKHGTAEVDDAFLTEIERWRDLLARTIALRNPQLNQRELNYAVQMTIDRLIFLRICEDRGIELYGQLLGLVNGEHVYARLCEVFRKADERYNSGLFHFREEKGQADSPDLLTLGLAIDDKPLKDIIHNVYYPDSPYEFSVLPADILGQVYEQFLGKVIRLTTGHRAVVEDKPEVKKAGGVFYTPTYIVEYIVTHTVGAILEDKKPGDKGVGKGEPLRVLDPACGSGSFLLGAYQYLLDWYRDGYVARGPAKWAKGRKPRLHQVTGGEWKLTTSERKRILLDHIYGVDIDPQAVEVTKLSLLLKVLEGENEETLAHQLSFWQKRALPDLNQNIKCGNSLIGPDFYKGRQMSFLDDEGRYRINAFDWQAEFAVVFDGRGGFDAVIGNPPYLFITELDSIEKEYYFERYKTTEYRFDVYGLFTELSIEHLLRRGGYLSFIVPHTLLNNDSFEKLRRLLLDKTFVVQAMDIGPGVFERARNETMIFIIRVGTGTKAQETTQVIQTTASTFPTAQKSFAVSQGAWAKSPGAAWLVKASAGDMVIVEKLERAEYRFGELCTINQGLRTGDNQKYLSDTQKGKLWKPVVGGKHVARYGPFQRGTYVCYEPKMLDAPRRREIFEAHEKLVVQEIRNITLPRRLIASYDDEQFFCLQSTNVINLRPSAAKGWNMKFLLGILNSGAANYFFRQRFASNNHIASNQIAKIPVPNVSLEKQTNIARLVDLILSLHRRLAVSKAPGDRTVLQRQIEATDREIDTAVYELYGLTRSEIKVVEERG